MINAKALWLRDSLLFFFSRERSSLRGHLHELSVCQALLAQVRDIVRAHRASGVTQIIVAVGPLSGIEPALLERAFLLARAGSCAANAELRFKPSVLRVRCTQCGTESACEVNRLQCRHCGGYRTQVISGDELLLLRVKLSVSKSKSTLPEPNEDPSCARPVAAASLPETSI